jgi:hypothetical protein
MSSWILEIPLPTSADDREVLALEHKSLNKPGIPSQPFGQGGSSPLLRPVICIPLREPRPPPQQQAANYEKYQRDQTQNADPHRISLNRRPLGVHAQPHKASQRRHPH